MFNIFQIGSDDADRSRTHSRFLPFAFDRDTTTTRVAYDVNRECIHTHSQRARELHKHNPIAFTAAVAMCAFPSIAARKSSDNVATPEPATPPPPRKPRIGTALFGQQPPPLRTGRQRRPTVRQHFGDALTSKLLVHHMAPCLWGDDNDNDDDTVSLAVSDDALQDATDELHVLRIDEGTDNNSILPTSSRTRLPKIVGNPILSAPDLSLMQ
jgi:hypothetical protein